ncbi:MAG: SGNH/GDSL hydrolase family protein [Clostridia bacterium]|nr:SGNH/GDSL hydrolase family protein [Clostridia bacterium]
MKKSDYNIGENSHTLETYEWDNLWIHQTGDENTPRILYIGDSISQMTRTQATQESENKLFFDGFASSKALDNPYFYDSISLFAKQEKHRDAVIFNNGLHGWHLNDEEQYPYFYEKTVEFLLEEFKGTPIFLVLTTSVTSSETELRVCERNKAVLSIAKKYNLPVIDLHSVSLEYSQFRKDDGIHYMPDGYKQFAKQIVRDLQELIR